MGCEDSTPGVHRQTKVGGPGTGSRGERRKVGEGPGMKDTSCLGTGHRLEQRTLSRPGGREEELRADAQWDLLNQVVLPLLVLSSSVPTGHGGRGMDTKASTALKCLGSR